MDEIRRYLDAARSIAALTGAGISAESGIPTFRGPGGLWRQYRPEDLATPQAFARDPLLVWQWYDWRRSLIAQAQPNPGHFALAEIERRYPFTLITQERRRSSRPRRKQPAISLKVHGDIWTLRCSSCGPRTSRSAPHHSPTFLPRRCPCSALERPGVVWFGESLPADTWHRAEQAARHADLFLVIGTSAAVYPAAGLVDLAKSVAARASSKSTSRKRRFHPPSTSPCAGRRPNSPGNRRMKICYLDAFSGISGDMTVGALLDAGASSEALLHALHSLNLEAQFHLEKTWRRGLAAAKFRVEAQPGQTHRHLHHILDLIARSALSDRARQNASAVFRTLADAESRVHRVPVEKVHFHEVGAVDSIADIAGACIAFDLLAADEIHCSPINTGSGTVHTEHGVLPVPAPATAALLQGKPVYARGPAVELTTPTGAALVATLAKTFGPLPPMRIDSIGYGAGDRDFPEQPNVLRALLGESTRAPESTVVSVIEANIDDSSPQVLGYALERLMDAGALDASLSPLQMKKNRPGSLLRVIANPGDQERLAQIVFAETSTLGLRIHTAERRVEERHIVEVDTAYGKIRIKVGVAGTFAPEYDDCRAIAHRTGTPLPQILAAANQAYLTRDRT